MKVEGDLSRGTRRGDHGDAASDVDGMLVEVSGEYGEDIRMARNHIELPISAFEPVVIHESDSRNEGRVVLNDDGRLPISELAVEEFEAFLAEEATVGAGLNGVDDEKSGTAGPVEHSDVVFELPRSPREVATRPSRGSWRGPSPPGDRHGYLPRGAGDA